jgi:glutamyl-tRNA reductase
MTLRKLPNLTEEERSYLDAMTKAIVKQILHEPIRSLKDNNHKSNGHLETIKELFSLDEKK